LHVVVLVPGDGTGDEEAHWSPYTTRQARLRGTIRQKESQVRQTRSQLLFPL
jgi:hypothetical protein